MVMWFPDKLKIKCLKQFLVVVYKIFGHNYYVINIVIDFNFQQIYNILISYFT